MKYLFLPLLFLICSCQSEEQIRARVWNAGTNEIYRDVNVDGIVKEEFLPTNSPKFLEFKCMHNKDIEALIRAARRQCDNPSKRK